MGERFIFATTKFTNVTVIGMKIAVPRIELEGLLKMTFRFVNLRLVEQHVRQSVMGLFINGIIAETNPELLGGFIEASGFFQARAVKKARRRTTGQIGDNPPGALQHRRRPASLPNPKCA